MPYPRPGIDFKVLEDKGRKWLCINDGKMMVNTIDLFVVLNQPSREYFLVFAHTCTYLPHTYVHIKWQPKTRFDEGMHIPISIPPLNVELLQPFP